MFKNFYAASLGVGLTPGLETIQDIYEIATGKNFFTKMDIGTSGYLAADFGLFLPVSGAVLKTGVKGAIKGAKNILENSSVLGRYDSFIKNKDFVPTAKISRIVNEFQEQSGKIFPHAFEYIEDGKQFFGGFLIKDGNPIIHLFKGADEATFMHEFVHFGQARKNFIDTFNNFADWSRKNRKTLENEADRILDILGYTSRN